MIVQNGRTIFKVNGTNASQNFTNLSGASQYMVTGNSPITSRMLVFAGFDPTVYHGYGTTSTYIEVGFGDTPEDVTDYNLADSNETNALLSCIASGKNSFGNSDIFNAYANFRNNGNSNVVVKEIGIIGNLNNNSSGTQYRALIWRKVLDTPVTIAPGETYTFSYNIRFKN